MKSKPVWNLIGNVMVCSWIVCLAACGSGPSRQSARSGAPTGGPQAAAAPHKAGINAPDFLTRSDAAAVLGKAVGDASVSGDGVNYSSCNYMAKDMSGVGLLVRVYGDDATAKTVFEQAKAQSRSLSNADPVAIEGLGEEAYWAGGNLNQMNVLKGNHWLVVSVFFGEKQSQQLAQTAAEKVLARLAS